MQIRRLMLVLVIGLGFAGTPQGVFATAQKELDEEISWSLVAAIAEIESGHDFYAVGRHGERGLMQIKKTTWEEISPKVYGRRLPFQKAFQPEDNLRVGKAYLHELAVFLGQFQDEWADSPLDLLIAAYNAGPNRVQEAGFRIDRCPPATRNYVKRVRALHKVLLREDELVFTQ
jgi:membrane-bound lytic murein transglycosylase MltF